jgi:hypothetical protein
MLPAKKGRVPSVDIDPRFDIV